MRSPGRARMAIVVAGAILGGLAAGLTSTTSHAAAHATGTTHEGLAAAVVGGAPTSTGAGWWEVGADGGIFSYGDATFMGSTGGMHLNSRIVGMSVTRSGHGYWLVASDGGIFSFGDAKFFGSTGAMRLNSPIVGMTVTHSGHGYWLVAADGGIFSFGDAAFFGSTGAIRLASPIVGMATHGADGYWLVAADGGTFAFGGAPFVGSAAGVLGGRAVGMTATPDGGGYWIAGSGGQVMPFGDAADLGTAVGATGAPIVAIIGQASQSLRLVAADGGSVGLSRNGTSVFAAAAPGTSTSYTWLVQNDDGSPARFDPCTPIHYVVNLREAPPGAFNVVANAFARLAGATGLGFVYDGQTTEVPTSSRAAVQGNAWAPVIVAWARPGETDLLPGGNTIGEGGSWWVEQGNNKVFVTGSVVIDPANTGGLLASFGAGTTEGELLLHELGHVVGLGHTQDPSQIMYPMLLPLSAANYGAGDLTGLRRLGRAAGCLSEPTPN